MKLTIFNGSPRRKASNTRVLVNKFVEGYQEHEPQKMQVHSALYLKDMHKVEEHVQLYSEAETAIIAFPLYADAMPGIVKHFMEYIARSGTAHPKNLGFIVQSGFPEAKHSVFVEKYLARFTARTGCHYLGTVIKGGGEGIRMSSEKRNRKLYDQFYRLGKTFAETGSFDDKIMTGLKQPYQFPKPSHGIIRTLMSMGLFDSYWKKQLKKHGAYHKRYDQPYREV
ncbi:MAG: NAD(P)H-dependent oxidoreductase [Bacteroidales bacterium]|nr:NAD(P)H-dependent oxidoreductase [Bacteroidales bacterium]